MLHNPNYRKSPEPQGLEKLWREVGNQVTGSDIESGYSYVYTWLANEFGHFMIGFAGTILIGWLFIGESGIDYSGLWPWAGTAIAVGWFVIWVLKEWLIDVASALRDLHFAEHQRKVLRGDKTEKLQRSDYILPKVTDLTNVFDTLRKEYISRHGPNSPEEWFKHDVVRDSQMDICCYLAGAFTSLAMYVAPGAAARLGVPDLTGWIPILAFVAALIALAHLSKDWLWANIAFDRAQLPFVSRFVLNVRPFKEKTRKEALDFATKRDGNPGHLIIIGPPKSGRTTTAVALGVEALLQTSPPREVVVYTTLCKLLDRVAEEELARSAGDQSGPPGTRPVWPPAAAELLIVDDVGAQGANGPLITPEEFEAELRANKLLHDICDKNHVIWVVGDDPRRSKKWIAALKRTFRKGRVVPRVLPPIKLQTTIPHRERLRSSQQRARISAYGT